MVHCTAPKKKDSHFFSSIKSLAQGDQAAYLPPSFCFHIPLDCLSWHCTAGKAGCWRDCHTGGCDTASSGSAGHTQCCSLPAGSGDAASPQKKLKLESKTGAIQCLWMHSRRENEGNNFTQVFTCLKIFCKITLPKPHNKLEELKEPSLCDPDHLPPGEMKDADWHGQQCKIF